MIARTTSEALRHVTRSISKGRNASRAALPAPKKWTPRPEHGQQIFVYNHLQKNMVVYSLTRSLKNNASLRQLPFNGKKTVPAALRKDLWHPFALISFPSGQGSVGLSAFQKLREYRKRHELEWGDEIMKDEKGKFVKKKIRARKICDQKANSVADIAAVLRLLDLQEGGEEVKKGGIGLKGEGTGQKVEVLWNDLNDAEFAETWSENVEHGVLMQPTKNRERNQILGPERINLEGPARLSGEQVLPPQSTDSETKEKVTL